MLAIQDTLKSCITKRSIWLTRKTFYYKNVPYDTKMYHLSAKRTYRLANVPSWSNVPVEKQIPNEPVDNQLPNVPIDSQMYHLIAKCTI